MTRTHARAYFDILVPTETTMDRVSSLPTTLTYLSFQLAVDVGEKEAGDLHQGDDEGALGHRAQVIADETEHGGQDGGQRQLGFVPEHRRVGQIPGGGLGKSQQSKEGNTFNTTQVSIQP